MVDIKVRREVITCKLKHFRALRVLERSRGLGGLGIQRWAMKVYSSRLKPF